MPLHHEVKHRPERIEYSTFRVPERVPRMYFRLIGLASEGGAARYILEIFGGAGRDRTAE
jgi:hypothetical protein